MNIPRKIECLFMLLSGIRVNTIVHLKITNMYLTDSECTFVFDELLKHSRPFNKLKPISFGAFPQNRKLSAITALMQYLNIRLLRSSDTALSITTVKQNHTKEHLKILLIVRSNIQCMKQKLIPAFFYLRVTYSLPQAKPMSVVSAWKRYWIRPSGQQTPFLRHFI